MIVIVDDLFDDYSIVVDFLEEAKKISEAPPMVHTILSKAGEFGIPVIASNEVRFIDKEDYEAHETRVCIQNGEVLSDSKRTRNYFEDQYFLSPEEMYEKFKDIPEVLSNAYELSKKCNLEIETGIYVLPDFETPLNKSASEYLIELSKMSPLRVLVLDEIKKGSIFIFKSRRKVRWK